MPTDAPAMTDEAGRTLADEFEQLVSRYHRDLLRLAYAMSGNRALAEDAVQACWQAAWRSRAAIRDRSRIRAWLCTVTANEVRRQLRRERLRRLLAFRVRPPEHPSLSDSAQLDLAQALRGLPLRDRQLLALRFGLGLTSGEIAEQLGLSPSGVRVRLQRVLTRLRTELADD
jgi:RNA polymerase sigma factor (sigma-70 family)